jgi:hypothetical protein
VAEAYDTMPNLRVLTPRKDRRAAKEEIAVAHISDTQIGKITATYDSEIAHNRLLEYIITAKDIIELRRSHAKIDELHIYFGGDMVEGELIFPAQAHSIDQSVFEQAVKTAPSILANVVLEALDTVRKVKVICVPGNHGRPASRKAGSHPKTNWDSVCYHITELLVLGPEGRRNRHIESRCEFVIPDNWYAIDRVFGVGNLIVHGHEIRGGFGGFPFYGVGKKMAGWIDAIPEDWTNLYFGHFHQYYSGEINRHNWFCNGSAESDNDYARQELASAGMPKQRLQFFNEDHGMISDNPIHLTYGLEK